VRYIIHCRAICYGFSEVTYLLFMVSPIVAKASRRNFLKIGMFIDWSSLEHM
jgi:hypothetical protein